MRRKDFIKIMATLPLAGVAHKANSLYKFSEGTGGNGQISSLIYRTWKSHERHRGQRICPGIQKNWPNFRKTEGDSCCLGTLGNTWNICHSDGASRTIHDFGGFPQALLMSQYPAPGSPALALETQRIVSKTDVHLDDKWGLDHGSWSVVNIYTLMQTFLLFKWASITHSLQHTHYEIAQQLNALRKKGVLIIGSGIWCTTYGWSPGQTRYGRLCVWMGYYSQWKNEEIYSEWQPSSAHRFQKTRQRVRLGNSNAWTLPPFNLYPWVYRRKWWVVSLQRQFSGWIDDHDFFENRLSLQHTYQEYPTIPAHSINREQGQGMGWLYTGLRWAWK